MKKLSLPVRIACAVGFVVVIGGMAIRSTINRNDRDYQLHPVAAISGSLLPSLFGGAAIFWWSGRGFRWKKQKRSCPNCTEEVNETATVCMHCGRNLPPSANEHSETSGLPPKATEPESTKFATGWGMRTPPPKTAGVLIVVVLVAAVLFAVVNSRSEKRKPIRLDEIPSDQSWKDAPIVSVPAVRWESDPLQTAYRDVDGTWWVLLNDGQWYYMVTARREASGKVWVQVNTNQTYSILPPYSKVTALRWK